MLWSIGVSAGLGVLAVLLGGDIALEILLSGLLTAVACLLAAGLSAMAKDDKARLSVLIGLGVIVAEYVVLLPLIWHLHERVGLGREFHGKVIASCWNAGVAGFLWVVLLRSVHAPAFRIASWIGLPATAAASITGFVAIWGVDGDTADRTGFTAISIALCAALALLSVVGRRWEDGLLGGLSWRWGGLVASTVSLILGLIVIWGEFQDTNPAARALTAFVAVALSIDHANLVGLLRLHGAQRWIAGVAWVTVTIALACVSLLVHDVTLRIGGIEWISRVGGAAGIVGGCGTLACVVLDVVQRRSHPRVDLESTAPLIRVECPRCLTLAERPPGESTCQRCGLTLMLRSEAPVCLGCGYSLAGLRSDVCPECGRRRDQSVQVRAS